MQILEILKVSNHAFLIMLHMVILVDTVMSLHLVVLFFGYLLSCEECIPKQRIIDAWAPLLIKEMMPMQY